MTSLEDEVAALKDEIVTLRSLSLKATCDNVFSVSIKLPPFDTDNLYAWFGMCEAQFAIRPVTKSETKASYILSNISVEAYRLITPWLQSQGGHPTYEDLREELLLTFDQGQSDRAQRILQFASTGMGDLDPRQLGSEIERLRTLPDGSKIDICVEILLQALPAGVRKLLGDIDGLTLKEVSERAFKSWKQFKADRQFPQTLATIDVQPSKGVDAVSHRRNYQYFPKKSAQPASSDLDSLCYYHRKFGENARSCVPPCAFNSKNAKSGRRF